MYGKGIELAKHLIFCLLHVENPYLPCATLKEKRLVMKQAIRHLTGKAFQMQSLQSLESLERLQRLQRLQSLESLQRLESLQSLERLQSLEMTNLDYREVTIEPYSVVYCDIPYEGQGAETDVYNNNFNRNEFLEWAASREFPVYISEYEITDNRFSLIWEKEVICKMTKKDGGAIMRTERLYWNGRANNGAV